MSIVIRTVLFLPVVIYIMWTVHLFYFCTVVVKFLVQQIWLRQYILQLWFVQELSTEGCLHFDVSTKMIAPIIHVYVHTMMPPGASKAISEQQQQQLFEMSYVKMLKQFADRPALRRTSHPPCCTQMCDKLVTDDGHQFTTLTRPPKLTDDQPFQRYGWCPPNLNGSRDLTTPL